MKIQLLFLLLSGHIGSSLSGQTTPLPHPSKGRIERQESFPSRYVPARHVDIWLPDGYSPRKRYDVWYFHDGQMLFDSTVTWNKQEWGVDETFSMLMERKKIRNCIVVGIWNSGAERHSEYFPQKPFEALPQDFRDSLLAMGKRSGNVPLFATSVRSDAYLKFITEELKPWIDAHYSTKKGRKHTFVAGSSMGGLISMYAISEYPDMFGGAVGLSTHWPGIFSLENNPIPDAFVEYVRQYAPSPENHILYFDHGTEGLDAMYGPTQQRITEVLCEKGYCCGKQNFATGVLYGMDHSERSWSKRLPGIISFMYHKTNPSRFK